MAGIHEIPVGGALLRALQKVKESPKTDTGICYLVEDHIGSAEEIIGELATSWPKWSGDGVYPVPCPESYLDRSREDPHCWAFCSLPKWEGEYGQLRMELLDFLINELEQANVKHSRNVASGIEATQNRSPRTTHGNL